MDKMVKRLLEARYDITKDTRTPEMDDVAQEIIAACRKAVETYMTGPRGGFLMDEVWDYAAVDMNYEESHDDCLMMAFEVRAEVSYEGLESLCDILNPIIEEYDHNAYFEPVTPGIIRALVNAEESIK